MLVFLSALMFSAFVAASPVTSPDAAQAIRLGVGAVLRGQGEEARSIFQALASGQLDARDQAFRDCALSRLDPASSTVGVPVEHAFVRDVMTLYQAYWRDSMRDPSGRPAAEHALVSGLTVLLGLPVADLATAEPIVQTRLREVGYFSQLGRTGALYDLMIWSEEAQTVEQVELPEGFQDVRVTYLDQFISRGWSSHFTCNRTGTGGWATADGLYVIVPSYRSLSDENFRVNFLAHESQHYADIKRFGGDLPGWRLEFRAKLVELAYAQDTASRTIASFATNQSDNPLDAHSYANRLVLSSVALRLGVAVEQLEQSPLQNLQQAAVETLVADTAGLQEARRSDAGP